MNFRAALRFLGRLMLLLAATELVPAVCAAFYRDWSDVTAFVIGALLTAVCGAVLAFVGRSAGQVFRREGILIVVGGWVLASIFGALPYLLTGTFTNPMDAMFEAVSGFTTTGASVMTDIEAQSRAILFWRSMTQWLGGMGIIVLFVALLPELGPGARFLYKLESPGPAAKSIQPRIQDSAAILWKLYLSLTVVQTGLLLVAGMNLYDAITHTFSTLSTGGFSPRNASVAAFDSVWVHLIIIVFMVIAGANFSLFYGLRLRRNWKLWKDTEFRLYVQIVAGATLFVAINLLANGTYERPFRALLDSAFQVASILTTTGFATADFDTWPTLSRLFLVTLMFVGGCAGSTSGSMKVMRMVIGLRYAVREAKLIFSPNQVLRVFVGGKPVPENVVRSVAGFFILYLSTWALGALLISVGGPDIVSTATASAAMLGNIGPGLGAVGPTQNFSIFGDPHKALMVLLMLLGRLEVYAIAALFTRAFWKA